MEQTGLKVRLKSTLLSLAFSPVCSSHCLLYKVSGLRVCLSQRFTPESLNFCCLHQNCLDFSGAANVGGGRVGKSGEGGNVTFLDPSHASTTEALRARRFHVGCMWAAFNRVWPTGSPHRIAGLWSTAHAALGHLLSLLYSPV